MRRARAVAAAAVAALVFSSLGANQVRAQSFVNFESGHVRPLATSPDGSRLFAVNTPDNRLEIFDVGTGSLIPVAEVPVGLEPVAVATRTNAGGRVEAWVVNHLSDSVSIVEIDPANVALSRVTRTLLTCDEPRDVVFAGTDGGRAFVTTARRGQNCPLAANLTTSGIGRAVVQVWSADSPGTAFGGTPIANIVLFGDTPRALAKSPDGSIVYAAVFHSGNQTTAIQEATVAASGNTFPPFPPGSTAGAPSTGLIVKWNPLASRWEDERGAGGPDWDAQVPFTLPDEDVFLIDAANATPQLFPSANTVDGVGTTIFNMAVRPDNGRVYVTNTEARNQVRFQPFVSATQGVQGHITESRITVIDNTTPTAHHLNPQIDYTCVPPSCPQDSAEVEASLAFPGDLVFSPDGHRVYVVGFGSQKVGIFDTDDLEGDIVTKTLVEVGMGPSGIVLDAAKNQLYVMNRIDHTISIVGNASTPATAAQIGVVPLRYDPSPDAAKVGRLFLYDARRTSAHGDQACASCHIFGDFDSLAWDLGDPFGALVNNPNPFSVGVATDFHPLKGPMVTQSLRGMADAGPMHWRGDRTGGNDPGGDPLDEFAAFEKFNPAFVGLLGRPSELPGPDMDAFTDFMLTVKYPPNPIRGLDDAATPAQQTGNNFFHNPGTDPNGVTPCVGCHALPLGTAGLSAAIGEPQQFKVPHLRNLYQKVGMFDSNADEVRGFGFLHDGSMFTLFDFLQSNRFSFFSNTTRQNVEQFLLAFDTGLKPAVGQQVSVTPSTVADVSLVARIDLLMARHEAFDCELVVKGNVDGEARGWMYVGAGDFKPDRNADAVVDATTLRNLAATPGQELTYTCVPPGSGTRIGVDRDEDGIFDRRELDCGTDPADPASFPPNASGPCGIVTTTTTTTTTSSTSTSAEPPSTTTTTGAAATTSTSTTLAPIVTTNVRTTALRLRDRKGPASRRFAFRSGTADDPAANRIVVPGAGSVGDPTSAGSGGGGAGLVVYNSVGSGEKVVETLPAAGWARLGTKGYRFKGTGAVSRVIVRNDSIRIRAGKAKWGYTLDEPSQGRVALRLQLGAGPTWCADAPAKSGGSSDVVGKFDAQAKTPAPGVCPTVP